MAEDSSKKIIINDGELEEENPVEGEGDVKIKKSSRIISSEVRQEKIGKDVSEFYKNKEFHSLDKPQKKSGRGWFIILSIVFGLLAGGLASVFILTRNSIKIPFYKEINLIRPSSANQTESVAKNNITITSDARTAELIPQIKEKTFKIFKQKQGEALSFLEQIYAPWQTIGLAVSVSNDGWLLMTGGLLDKAEKYVAISQQNKIYNIETTIQDSVSRAIFCKISSQDLPVAEIGEIDSIKSGQQVLVIDKNKNFYPTEISQPNNRTVYKTEDLVRSTDKYSEYLRLGEGISAIAVPQGIVFGLDGMIIGLMSGEKVLPIWQIQGLVKQVLAGQEIKRPYLGFDYLRIEEAPGLISPLFKDMSYGAIIYGQPTVNSPAEKAGLKNADVIVEVGTEVLDGSKNFTHLIQSKNPGDEIEISFVRAGEQKTIKIILGELK